jgi:hypothetical protein
VIHTALGSFGRWLITKTRQNIRSPSPVPSARDDRSPRSPFAISKSLQFTNSPIQVTEPRLAYITLGGFVVLVRIKSPFQEILAILTLRLVQRVFVAHPRESSSQVFAPTDERCSHQPQLYISEVVLGTAFGVIIGPYGAGIFSPRHWAPETGEITLEVMRVVLAVGLFAIGVELPESYMMKHVRGLVVLVVPTMAIGWIVVAGMCTPPSANSLTRHISPAFMLVLFPSLSFISCLAISACLTPTDPVISAAIVGMSF